MWQFTEVDLAAVAESLGAAGIMVEVLLAAVALLAGAAGALSFGFTLEWDLLNYQLYNPHALLTGRGAIDVAPAQLQTFLNPALHLPVYLLFRYAGPAVLIAVVASSGCTADEEPGPRFISPLDGQTGWDPDVALVVRSEDMDLPEDYALPELLRVVDHEIRRPGVRPVVAMQIAVECADRQTAGRLPGLDVAAGVADVPGVAGVCVEQLAGMQDRIRMRFASAAGVTADDTACTSVELHRGDQRVGEPGRFVGDDAPG